MLIAKTVAEVRASRWDDPSQTWGLVPTMGALHEGHLSLVRQARAGNDKVGVSIFVNPTQFNNPDDLNKYPRNLEHDCELLRAEGVDVVWAPEPSEVYPPGYQTTVMVEQVTKLLEGVSRPGHFQGVTTVVTKLFNVFQPTRAYFGQKDAQQVAVIKQMVRDLNVNLELVVCPIVREDDGLAMSSRNARLSAEERKASTVLYGALFGAAEAWRHGERDASMLRGMMTKFIRGEPLAKIDYVSVTDPVTLVEIDGRAKHALLSLAVFIGEIRLIDNMVVGN